MYFQCIIKVREYVRIYLYHIDTPAAYFKSETILDIPVSSTIYSTILKGIIIAGIVKNEKPCFPIHTWIDIHWLSQEKK